MSYLDGFGWGDRSHIATQVSTCADTWEKLKLRVVNIQNMIEDREALDPMVLICIDSVYADCVKFHGYCQQSNSLDNGYVFMVYQARYLGMGKKLIGMHQVHSAKRAKALQASN